jgi:hypothetical protein
MMRPVGRRFGLRTDKYDQMVAYIAKRNESNPRFGSTILNKTVVDAEFRAFLQLGKPIAGSRAQHERNGPVSRPLKTSIRSLARAGIAFERQDRVQDHTRSRLVVTEKAQFDLLSEEEKSILDECIAFWWNRTAAQASDLAHARFVGWSVTEEGDDIPYESAYLCKPPLTEAEREFVIGLQRQVKRLHGN